MEEWDAIVEENGSVTPEVVNAVLDAAIDFCDACRTMEASTATALDGTRDYMFSMRKALEEAAKRLRSARAEEVASIDITSGSKEIMVRWDGGERRVCFCMASIPHCGMPGSQPFYPWARLVGSPYSSFRLDKR